MKTKMMFTSLALCVAMCCDVYGSGLLDRMLGRDGGGCGCDAAPAATCCDTPAPCRSGFKLNLNCGLRLPKLLNRGCCDSGNACDTGNACGCDAPAAAPACDSGCGNACGGGLLSGRGGFGLRRGCNTGCDTGCDTGCGCNAPAAAPACDSGCGNACDPCGRGNFFGRLKGLIPQRNNCGCDTGCDTGCAPAADNGCGCDAGCGRVARCREPRQACASRCGLISRVRSMGSRGCDAGCDSGCDAGCGCNGGAAPAAQPAAEPAPVQAPQGAFNQTTPVVDPNAFIIRGAKYSGSNN